MSMFKISGLFKKTLMASLFSITLIPNSAFAMWGSGYPGEWDEAKLNELLDKQNYAAISDFTKYYVSVEQRPDVIDWLNKAAREGYHAPCMYDRFRWFVHAHAHCSPDTKYLKRTLAWMIIALVLTKADADCCAHHYHLFKNNKTHPFDLLIENYSHRLKKCKPSYLLSYEKVRDMADEMFVPIARADLPLPLWVCTVANTTWASEWVDFGGTSDDAIRREELRKIHAMPTMIVAVKKIRKASFAATWQLLKSLRNWEEFFALRANNFERLDLKFTQDDHELDLFKSHIPSVNKVADTLKNMTIDPVVSTSVVDGKKIEEPATSADGEKKSEIPDGFRKPDDAS